MACKKRSAATRLLTAWGLFAFLGSVPFRLLSKIQLDKLRAENLFRQKQRFSRRIILPILQQQHRRIRIGVEIICFFLRRNTHVDGPFSLAGPCAENAQQGIRHRTGDIRLQKLMILGRKMQRLNDTRLVVNISQAFDADDLLVLRNLKKPISFLDG